MRIKIDVPNWTKLVTVTYVYYAGDGEEDLTAGMKALAGQALEDAEIEEDDCR
ncbi:MAG: hypothetical protein J6S50_05725 [Oscillospiraceae bacterium]|nr:hypothetical protein [Lachnospiraceae bacterium]MBO7727994.1 hypothetical protein [Oscillospiraceae bacterium]